MAVCGIFGYIGDGSSYNIVRDGLERLAYRGYDSAGIVSIGLDGYVSEKCVGHPEELAETSIAASLSLMLLSKQKQKN